MSASLRNARSHISALQGRLEGLNLLNMDNVQAMVDRQVENITGVVNKLSSTCTTACPVQNTPQCKPVFTKISFYFCYFEYSNLFLSHCMLFEDLSIFFAIYYIFHFDWKLLSLCLLLGYILFCSNFAISIDASPSFFAIFLSSMRKPFLYSSLFCYFLLP